MNININVNGSVYDLEVEPRRSLADALRLDLGLTGTKIGCNQGACGACTVLVDGVRVLGCLTVACAVDGAYVTTIEGLGENGRLHAMQEAFLANDALQCGFCTPGQIMSALGALNEGVPAQDDAVTETMSGNLCRCAAYPGILRAIRSVQDNPGPTDGMAP